jgi:hypothetical protein
MALLCRLALALSGLLQISAARAHRHGRGWQLDEEATTLLEPSSSSPLLVITVALRLDAAGLRRMKTELDAKADPSSSRHGTPHWSQRRVSEELSPPASHHRAVCTWLRGCGASMVADTDLQQYYGYVRAEISVANAARCFGVSLWHYRHSDTGARTVAAAAGSRPRAGEVPLMPAHIAPLIDFLAGLDLPPAAPRKCSLPGP